MIIKGDVNGDGKITLEDWILVQLHSLGIITLTGDAFKAADINGDDEISLSDLTLIRRHIFGTHTINEVIE